MTTLVTSIGLPLITLANFTEANINPTSKQMSAHIKATIQIEFYLRIKTTMTGRQSMQASCCILTAQKPCRDTLDIMLT